MKKLILTLIVVAFVTSVSFAKEETKTEDNAVISSTILSGQVVDKVTGEELAGVAVHIDGTDKVCYTDFDGNFAFNEIEPGQYKLDIEMISYNKVETKSIKVEAHEAHDLKIKLEQEF